MKENFLIKIHTTSEEDKELLLTMFETSNITEYIKLFNYMKENNISLSILENLNNSLRIKDFISFSNERAFYIEDINFVINNIGEKNFNYLDVWVE